MIQEKVVLTDIKKTKRERWALFGNEEFLFSVDEETMVRCHLKIGAALTVAELEAVRAQSDERRAKDKALEYVALRDYGETELYRKLCLKFDEETSAAAVAKMRRLELVNDANFAAHRAVYLQKKGKSRREIQSMLAALGLSREDIGEAMQALLQTEEETLAGLIEKSYLTRLAAGKRDTVIAALARRGFPINAIVRAVEEYVPADEEEML